MNRILSVALLANFAVPIGCVLPPIGDALLVCTADADCPTSQVCVQRVDDKKLCRPAGQPCVATIGGLTAEQADGTACPGVDNGICLAGACVAARCGDGVVSGDETCDGSEGCRADCSHCGDGVVDDTELCDDGDDNSDLDPGACRADCVPAACGDGVRDPDESCDDGALNDDSRPDACRTSCLRATCGDGVIDAGETCDDSNTASGDGCRADCLKVEACGDGVVDPQEACDDDNDNPRDGCDECLSTTWAVSVPLLGRPVSEGGFALTNPGGVAIDAVGGVYVADTGAHRVLRLDPDGSVVVIAGTGTAGFSGDGGPAIAAELRGPTDIAVAPDGVVFIADHLSDRIRSVDLDGIIRTFAGGAVDNPPNDGDNAIASLARLRRPRGLAANADAVVVAEEGGGRLRGISRTAPHLIATLAGDPRLEAALRDGRNLFDGRLESPIDVAFEGANLLVVEAGGRSPRIRRVRLVEGEIATVAGGGGSQPGDTPRTATNVSLQAPASVVVLDTDHFLFTDQGHRRVFQVSGTELVAVAGNGGLEPVAPGGESLATALRRPGGLTGTPGRLIVADEGLHMVRAFSTTVTDLLGTGQPGVTAEGAAATSVTLVEPVAVVPAGEALFIADADARRIYRRDATGVLTTIAGTGDVGQAIDGALARESPITPGAMVRRADGTLVVVESVGGVVRVLEITPEGFIVLLAGDETFFNDGVQLSIDASGRVVLAGKQGVAVENDQNGGFDVFRVPPVSTFSRMASESPTTVVGLIKGVLHRVTLDFDTSSATVLPIPGGGGHEDATAIAVSPTEGIFVGSASDGVQLLNARGELVSVVPGGTGRTGDGGPASGATINDPAALVIDDVGRLLIVDGGSGTIRRVGPAPSNVIETVAGDLHPSGPGALAQAALYGPQTLALLPDGSLVAGGAVGRLLHVRLDGPGGVDVVVGQPSPSPSPVAGPGGLTPARHLPLLPLASAFAVELDDPLGPSLKLVGDRRLHRIDTTTTPAAWEASVNSPLDVLVGASHIARIDATHVAVTDRDAHCVRRLRADTLAVVDVLFGTCGSPGAFAGFVRDPGALAVGPGGTIYLADTGNHRVLRRSSSGGVAVVIGDGSSSSAGQGSPARDFPLQAPGQLALDASGNLFIASTTTVRLVANVDGDADADGDDAVFTIYGRGNRDVFPERDSRCLAGLVLDEDDDRLFVADACAGFVVALDLVELP